MTVLLALRRVPSRRLMRLGPCRTIMCAGQLTPLI